LLEVLKKAENDMSAAFINMMSIISSCKHIESSSSSSSCQREVMIERINEYQAKIKSLLSKLTGIDDLMNAAFLKDPKNQSIVDRLIQNDALFDKYRANPGLVLINFSDVSFVTADISLIRDIIIASKSTSK
jgi:hypothetical protein